MPKYLQGIHPAIMPGRRITQKRLRAANRSRGSAMSILHGLIMRISGPFCNYGTTAL